MVIQVASERLLAGWASAQSGQISATVPHSLTSFSTTSVHTANRGSVQRLTNLTIPLQISRYTTVLSRARCWPANAKGGHFLLESGIAFGCRDRHCKCSCFVHHRPVLQQNGRLDANIPLGFVQFVQFNQFAIFQMHEIRSKLGR